MNTEICSHYVWLGNPRHIRQPAGSRCSLLSSYRLPPLTNLGVDPYDSDETDPQRTGALESSLWELHTLQDHYNPTVAQICRIISEQFTKQQYNIEDFLDHGYLTMLESELKKDGKKEPVVEFRIPKKLFEREVDVNEDEQSRALKIPDPLFDIWTFY